MKLNPYEKRLIREVLGGAISWLDVAFIWRHTPQGVEHWNEVWQGRKRLSKRSRQYLNRLLNS